jgi:hypothetical protein
MSTACSGDMQWLFWDIDIVQWCLGARRGGILRDTQWCPETCSGGVQGLCGHVLIDTLLWCGGGGRGVLTLLSLGLREGGQALWPSSGAATANGAMQCRCAVLMGICALHCRTLIGRQGLGMGHKVLVGAWGGGATANGAMQWRCAVLMGACSEDTGCCRFSMHPVHPQHQQGKVHPQSLAVPGLSP